MNDKTINKSESSDMFKRHRISVENYKEWIDLKKPHILIDVRTEPEIEICALDSSINIPLDTIQSDVGLNEISKLIEEQSKIVDAQETNEHNETYVVLVCRRGNDSQIARQTLEKYFNSKKIDNKLIISDIIGGLEAWANRINGKFPKY